MLKTHLNAVIDKKPRIHCITNIVSANLTANGLIACGASPIMAQDPEEVYEICTACDGLSLNLGTPNPRKIEAMLIAGRTANELGRPVVLDPVAVGASKFRMRSAQKLLESIEFSAIRGNISEIKSLAVGTTNTYGVDAEDFDENSLDDIVYLARRFSQKTKAVVAVSAAVDVVTDGKDAYIIKNGTKMLSKVTGSGCMLTAISTAYIVANPENPLMAMVSSLCALGVCGERAEKNSVGNGSFAVNLLDEISNLQGETLSLEAKYELF